MFCIIMYNILVISDSSKYRQHPAVCERMRKGLAMSEEGVSPRFFDMNCCMAEHEKFYTIKDMEKDAVITLDLAGFEMVNITGVLSYDSFSCRMAHLIFDKAYKYGDALTKLQNLSMFTYITGSESLEDFRAEYPLIPNVARHDLGGGLVEPERYAEWFASFTEDARL